VRIPPKAVPLEAVDTSLANGSVVSVVTEDAEAIHIDERRDTIESPPFERPQPIVQQPIVQQPVVQPIKEPSIEPISDEATVPTSMVVETRPVVAAARTTSGDAVAAQRGIARIRMPRVSKRYQAIATPRARSSRRLVLGSVALAGTSLAITVGALLSRSSVAEPAQGAQVTQAAQPTSIAQPAPASQPAPAAQPAPASQPAPAAQPAPAVQPAPAAQPAPAEQPAALEPAITASSTCQLDVRASIADAIVWVDGVRVGQAPVRVAAACNSVANVELRHPRYATFQQAVSVDAGAPEGTSTLDAQLEREKTTLTLWSEPAGAQVTYNGSVVGRTPVTIKVPRYEQGTVWFRAANHEADWRKIVPTEATKTVTIKLKGMILRPPS
jgi:hypothetical protein